MKKLFILAVLVCAGFSLNAQNFNVGVGGGLPIGDAGDAFTISAVVDASYQWEVSEGFYAGAATGLIYSIGDSDLGVDDFGFVPVAAAGRYAVSENFTLGADVGYALGVAPSEAEGGFYYAPRAQYYFTETISAVLAYRSVGQEFVNLDNITLGVEFKL